MTHELTVHITNAASPAASGKGVNVGGLTVYPQGGLTIQGPRREPAGRGTDDREYVYIFVGGSRIKCIMQVGQSGTTFIANLITQFDLQLP